MLRWPRKEVDCEVPAIPRMWTRLISSTRMRPDRGEKSGREVTFSHQRADCVRPHLPSEITVRFVVVDDPISRRGHHPGLVRDEQEFTRRGPQLDFAGSRRGRHRSQSTPYVHRAALGCHRRQHTGKSSWPANWSRSGWRKGALPFLDGENSGAGLTRPWERRPHRNVPRREVARLLIDTGLSVISTTNPSDRLRQALPAIPMSLRAIHRRHMSKADEELPPTRICILPDQNF